MTEALGLLVGWLVPAAIVLAVAVVAIAVAVWAVRRIRRSPRAHSATSAARDAAGAAIVRLDDALTDLDLEATLTGALHVAGAPVAVRRARLAAQHTRDGAFDALRAASDPALHPARARRDAVRVEQRATAALGSVADARVAHDRWADANAPLEARIAGVAERLADVRRSVGDPAALVADLSRRFDEGECAPAAQAAARVEAELHAADRFLADARDGADAQASLVSVERALRGAEGDARALEESHRLVTQASLAVAGEFEAARGALRSAAASRASLDTQDAETLSRELREIGAALDSLIPDAARRPTRTVDAIARLRDRLDEASGGARTARQEIRGARTALPGTLAAARAAVARAESAVAHAPVDAAARLRLLSAQAELALARRQSDPVAALDAARRALHDAGAAIVDD